MKNYLSKMRGGTKVHQGFGLGDVLWSSANTLCGIGAVVLTNQWVLKETDLVLVLGSFGASAVLVYGTIKSPLAQPRNFIGGHIISAIIGVTVYRLLPVHAWLAAPISVAAAITIMFVTKTLHPPGGATALIAVVGSEKIHALGYMYVITPVGIGVAVMLAVALLMNNIPKNRNYPDFWF